MGASANPVLAKAAPYAASAGAAYLGKKLSGPSKEQRAGMEATAQAGPRLNAAGGTMLQQGSGLAGQGAGYLQQAGQYYGNIMGNRRAATEALAPETTTALEYYRGAGNKTKRTMTGGSRDMAVAELDRQKVGQLAGMLPAARRAAAEGLGNIGGTAISGGTGMTGQAADLYGTAADIGGQQFQQASDIRAQQQAGGKSWGGAAYDILQNTKGGGKKGKKPPIPSSSYSPNLLMQGPQNIG